MTAAVHSICVSHASSTQPPPPAAVPDENLTINELVREYLVFNHYTASLSVLLAETGATGTTALTRGELAMLTGVVDDAHSRRVPLLYELVEKSKATRHGTGPDRHV